MKKKNLFISILMLLSLSIIMFAYFGLIDGSLFDADSVKTNEYISLESFYSTVNSDSIDSNNFAEFQTHDGFISLSYPSNWSVQFTENEECNPYFEQRSKCIIIESASLGFITIQYIENIPEEYGEPSSFSGYQDQYANLIETQNAGLLFRNEFSNYVYEGDLSSVNIFFVNEIFEKTNFNEKYKISSFGTGANWFVNEGIGINIVYHLNITGEQVPSNETLKLFDQTLSTLSIDSSVRPFSN